MRSRFRATRRVQQVKGALASYPGKTCGVRDAEALLTVDKYPPEVLWRGTSGSFYFRLRFRTDRGGPTGKTWTGGDKSSSSSRVRSKSSTKDSNRRK